ncbi:spore germination B3 GerAC family protein [Desulforamulus reducens MI-1]|uniref:Spore germination B3 GerAC family protein n=1 Tax=Desulforamulus reducens (strain ATCC BAA-1160 / DSM 100696 / MI-1) TaxID=349161 RepID=A4J7W9_DESRM|nr:Ger(x)C family spore germination protein [Desulforamulus reducens]ABO51172.1 spore germination B3 GerAC family protein [Desulforamulus reducens MI-1]
MVKKIKPKAVLLLLLLITVLTTGCWDAADVKDIVIPFIAGFDYEKIKGQGKFYLYINNPVVGEAREKSDVLVAEGETVGDTRVDRGNKSARSISVGDLKGFLFGKELASRGLEETFDILYRNPRISKTPNLAVVDGMAKDIFYLKPKNFQTVGENVLDMFKNSSKNNFIPDETIHNFRINALTPGFNPVLPVLSIHGQDKIKISGAALFKKYKMVAMINAEDMRVLTWLRGEEKKGDILFELTDKQGGVKKIAFEGGNKRSVKAKLENGQPVFEVEIKLKGMVAEALGDFRFAGEEKNVELAEKALEEQVKRQCESFIEDLQYKYRVDAILLGKYARIYWPELVEKQDWDEVFCNSEIRVKVKVVIQGSGEVA